MMPAGSALISWGCRKPVTTICNATVMKKSDDGARIPSSMTWIRTPTMTAK